LKTCYVVNYGGNFAGDIFLEYEFFPRCGTCYCALLSICGQYVHFLFLQRLLDFGFLARNDIVMRVASCDQDDVIIFVIVPGLGY
jgi:hypothetical protein